MLLDFFIILPNGPLRHNVKFTFLQNSKIILAGQTHQIQKNRYKNNRYKNNNDKKFLYI